MIIVERYKDKKVLNHYISMFDINDLSNSVLIIENDDSVSIDVVVLRFEVEQKVSDISSDLSVEFVELDRYSDDVVIRFGYKNVNKVVRYQLVLSDKNND
jgi:hypothetical protein